MPFASVNRHALFMLARSSKNFHTRPPVSCSRPDSCLIKLDLQIKVNVQETRDCDTTVYRELQKLATINLVLLGRFSQNFIPLEQK